MVPKVFGSVSEATGEVRRPTRIHVVLRRTPSAGGQILTTITSSDMLAAGELSHQVDAAQVDRREHGWSRVWLRDGGTGWISPGDSGTYLSFASLIEANANEMYFAGEYVSVLATDPGGHKSVPVPRDSRRRIIGYLEGVGPTVRVEDGPAAQKILDSLNGSNAGLVVTATGKRFIEFQAGQEVPVFDRPEGTPKVVANVRNHWGGFTLVKGDNSRIVVFSRRPGWFEVAVPDEEERNNWRKWRNASCW